MNTTTFNTIAKRRDICEPNTISKCLPNRGALLVSVNYEDIEETKIPNSVFNEEQFVEEGKIPDTVTPGHNDTIWVVRISERKNAANMRRDYEFLKTSISNGDKSVWDKDSKNRMKKGDWLGFIVGPNKHELVDLYYIEFEENTESRLSHWNKNEPYIQNSNTLPKSREVVVFKKQSSIIISWSEWRHKVGYKETYIPMGTTKAKNYWNY